MIKSNYIVSKNITIKKALPYIFIIASIIGLIASLSLTYDKIQVLKNPAYVPSCNLNPILSCGDVMNTKQADILGLPNPVFGIIGFGMLFAFGLALAAGAVFKRWLWLVINAGALIGFVFFVYLFTQAVYRIHAICPWCFAVWMILPPVLWYTTLFNIREKNLKLTYIKPKVKSWIFKHHGEILFIWYLYVFLTLFIKFWYYWKTII
jgi:uncharacterized membrane protein